jgi:hypothetical protein
VEMAEKNFKADQAEKKAEKDVILRSQKSR